MSNKQTPTGGYLNYTPLIFGAALMGIGAMTGLAGLVLSSSAVIRAARRWVQQMDKPPAEVAKVKLAQAKAATNAGVSAWQNGLTTSGTR